MRTPLRNDDFGSTGSVEDLRRWLHAAGLTGVSIDRDDACSVQHTAADRARRQCQSAPNLGGDCGRPLRPALGRCLAGLGDRRGIDSVGCEN
jgi:hypothetical protein